MSGLKTGIIGCGNISPAYFKATAQLNDLDVVACADLNMDAARVRAEEYGVRAMSVDELLADPEIKLVINLTLPQAHAAVNTAILNAGKHAHCEKPFAITRDEGKAVLALAEEKGLRVGGAPDTFLGAGLQSARKIIDDGLIGRPVSGTAVMACPGHESWHPNPGFYYLTGGGPLFDMGPYYITALIHLLGPVRRVTALNSRAFSERIATSEAANGKVLPVEVDTHVTGILEFHSGAVITMIMSFDVKKHSSHNIEIHGTEGSLKVPDPNHFHGENLIANGPKDDWRAVPLIHPYADNMRGIGAADMAAAVRSGRAHRCNGEMASHVLDVMHALGESSDSGQHRTITSTCAQPAPLPADLVFGELD